MTTAGSNDAPESGAGDEDPFAYLYRPAEGEAPGDRPRSSYSRPMEVGRANYDRPAQPAYARPMPAPDAPTMAVPHQSRYAERSRPQPGEDRPSGGRGKAAVIGAVAVVAAIAIGAGIALSTGDPDGKPTAGGGHSSAPATQPSGSASPVSSASASASGASADPVADSSKLQAQGAPAGSGVKGAVSADGGYLTLQPGSSVTWTVNAPAAGQYKFWLHFNNTGGDLPAAVAVNGQDRDGGVTFKNYSKGNTDPAQGWFSTNIWPQLQAGTNTLTVSLPAGSSGSVLLDQVALTAMSVNSYPTK